MKSYLLSKRLLDSIPEISNDGKNVKHFQTVMTTKLRMMITLHYEAGYIDDLCRGQYIISLDQHFVTNWYMMCISKWKINQLQNYFQVSIPWNSNRSYTFYLACRRLWSTLAVHTLNFQRSEIVLNSCYFEDDKEYLHRAEIFEWTLSDVN